MASRASSGAAMFYRLYAARCVEIAHHISDPESKATLLNMAQSWLVLADQADKNREVTLVYETPEPRQRVAQQQQQPQPPPTASRPREDT